ncbi:MAG: 2-C-methyl-D-erythritol 4-phosphate cytidylyltransferase [Ignavibacteriaceae bacterium]|nr:2-C-methyl-D-erythritol 4-phosphate cytidylyltransferase [Ignavibacterium sp.]MCC6255740.1 2-C-methyl-D-erythritol 4-phosphate cytidylyltransferase [Ignavibacteriaceae bacterium]HMN25514.1 2-C-methyl-D-erythritol 4-phosphate cytidylyltransferase [Ignavibacteriaceae bacterium]HRN26454.1 2-C-methyl-D-erythritol 4-phosphate cytidylyltransferase [Ignavibacteriaceae bacterium]HRP92010.1 2-C-methyl-D-erythritol 4-phosphate cytidylyltransferase [Ignavibacteriaceae bacterium]
MTSIAIIPAGGKGFRSGYSTPKQYLKVHGKEIIVYTLQIFQKNKFIDEIIIAAEPEYFYHLIKLINKYKLSKVKLIVEGGSTRQQSVFNAVLASEANESDLIVVHDAARALLPSNILSDAIQLAKQKGNALVCIKAKDTLIKGKNTVDEYLNRDEVYYVQTPQIFKYKDLRRALIKAEKENFVGTDESMLIRRTGKKVHIAQGSVFNFKITTKEDVDLFKKLTIQ